MVDDNHYQYYRSAIQKIIENEEQLPSLPSITLKIRGAIHDPDTSLSKICQLIKFDPSLTALVLKQGSSPLYLRPEPPKTIEAVLNMIGISALERLVMLHSIKSLFILQKPQLKSLFKDVWERMIFKAAISQVLAHKLGFRPSEEALSTGVLTDAGTLVMISAFTENMPLPDKNTYFNLSKKYGKSITQLLLRKWGMPSHLIKLTEHVGHWGYKDEKAMTILDILNLANYTTIQYQSLDDQLPSIDKLVSYQKLPVEYKTLNKNNQLILIEENFKVIKQVVSAIC